MVRRLRTKTKESEMFGFLKANPAKALEKSIAKKRLEAVEIQRSGDLRAFARLSSELFDLENQLIDELNRETEG
jgi:hypothetical protein